MKLSKEQFEKLYSDDISKKEYDNIIKEIDIRYGEVVLLIHPNICKKGGWFVYGNYDYHSEKDDGFFDVDEYKESISIGGEFNFPEPYCFSDDGNGYIPTRWLWTDDAEILREFNEEVEKYKAETLKKKEIEKQKRDERKTRKLEMQKIISAKLTKEELKYISFK